MSIVNEWEPSFLVTCHRKIVHGLCRCQYIPGSQMTVVLNGKGHLFEG